jgi:hypothetical protein
MSLDIFMDKEVTKVGSNTIINDRDDPFSRAYSFLTSLESRLLLLSWKFASLPEEETLKQTKDYLRNRNIENVTVRAGHSRVLEDTVRLFTDEKLKDISLLGRIFLGIPTTLVQGTLAKLSRAAHYNPFTKTAMIYTDVPAVSRHELGHAQDFGEQKYPTLYALARRIPGFDLFQEAKASSYAHQSFNLEDKWQSGRYLAPAFSTYLGRYTAMVTFLGTGSAKLANVAGLATVGAGHVVGNLYAGIRKFTNYVTGVSQESNNLSTMVQSATTSSSRKEGFFSKVGNKLKDATNYISKGSGPKAVGATA